MDKTNAYINDLFDRKVINWKVIEGSIFKRREDKSILNPDDVIGEMIGLVREIEDIN